MSEPRSLSEYRAALYGDAVPDRALVVRGWLFLVLLALLVVTLCLYLTGSL